MFRTAQSRTISISCGAAAFALSIAVLYGWKTGLPWFTLQPTTWSVMVVPTAVCFLLSGSALLSIALLQPRYQLHTKRILAFTILFIAAVRGIELVLNISLGLDATLRSLLHITYLAPGKMGAGSVISFILFSVGLILHERIQYSITELRFITAALFSIALVTVIDYGLKLEYLYEWIGTVHMALHTALGMMILSLGLWSLWSDAAASQFFRQKNETLAIQRRTTIMVIVATFTAGLIGFGIVRWCLEKVVHDNLNQLAADRRLFFNEVIQQRLQRAAVLQSPAIQRLPAILDTSQTPQASQARLNLERQMHEAFQPLSANGFTGLALEHNGEIHVPVGKFPLSPQMIAPLNAPHLNRAQLIWHQGHYLLRAWILISKYQGNTTYLITDQPIPLLTQLSTNKLAFGKNAVAVVCYDVHSASSCFPNQSEPHPFQIPKQFNAQVLPMTYALQQQSGIKVAQDYRGKRVIAAYGPIGTLGLGMVIKMELAEIYQPIKDQLHTMIPLIMGLIVVGLWWIKRSILPLMATVMESRQQLEASLKWRSAILESAAVSVISTNTVGTISSFNKAAQRMLGYTEVDMVNRQSLAILHDPNEVLTRAQELNSELDLNLEPNFEVFVAKARLGSVDEHEWTYIHKDGSRLSVSLAVTALRNLEGVILGFLCIAYDLTERKKVESLKNEFIATVSHELRTPLTSIRGSLGLLVAGAVGEIPSSAMTLLNIANTNCERLVRLINDFLDIEKMESGNMQFNMVIQPFMPVVEQSIQSMQAFAAQFEVAFALHADGPIGYVNIDADRISQVIVNLLSNAAKFTPAESCVDINVSQQNNHVRFSVRNYGKGIPEAYRGRIFGKFMQVNENKSRHHGGTGLGLNISKAIVEKHQGIIDFKSEVDQFTEFFFELPLAVTPLSEQAICVTDTSAAISTAPENTATIQKALPRILICEDNPDIAQLLSYMLADENFESDIAYNADAARHYCASTLYDAITLNINLPNDDGVFLMTWLRSEEKTRCVPIIIISIEAAEPSTQAIRENLLIKDWITNPIDKIRLRKSLHSALMLDSKTSSTLPVILHVEYDQDLVLVVSELLQSKCTLIHAPTLEIARKHLEHERVNAIILDIALPDGSGEELLTSLPPLNANTPVLIFSGLEVQYSSLNNVCAMLIKSRFSEEQLVTTICTVLNIPTEKPAV